MRLTLAITLSLVGLGSTGPARRDCGLEKCYDAINNCGRRYGGCWTACENGIMELPRFTVPPCSQKSGSVVTKSETSLIQTPDTMMPSIMSAAKSLITSPPSQRHVKVARSGKSRTCSPLWLCIDNLAICRNSTQIYGGCYDVCTSRPPYTSPLCSLSSSTTGKYPNTTDTYPTITDTYLSNMEPISITTASGYAIPPPGPEPGIAYTTDAPVDSIAPATDDSRALVMVEMPSVDAAVSAANSPAASIPTPDADELRIANVPTEQAAPTAEASKLVEAPQFLRGAAIAKLLANKDRKAKTENKPCWNDPSCKEVQLGIPSPLPSSAETSSAPTAPNTAGVPPESPTDLSEDASTETSSIAPTDTSPITPTDTPAANPEEDPTEASADTPAAPSAS